MTKVAVVGCGYWGPNLIRNFYGLEQAELAAVCDMDEARLAPVRRMYPSVRTTTRFDEILESDIEGIALATPARTHFSLGMKALAKGKHLLVEKPLAMDAAECGGLIDAARRKNLVLMVGHTFLYSPALLKVKELATPEVIGDNYYLYTQRLNLGRVQKDMNALWSLAPHDISIAMFLMGSSPTDVSAKGFSYLTPGIEDVVFMTLGFPGGQMAHIHVSWIDPGKVRKVVLVGSKKMIVYDDVADEGKVKIYDKAVLRQNGAVGEWHYRLHSGEINAPRIAMTEPLANECAHFVECIRDGKQPVSDGVNGLQVVRVLEAGQRSLESHGAPMRVEGTSVADIMAPTYA